MGLHRAMLRPRCGDVRASPRPPQARGCGRTVPGTLGLWGSGCGLKHPGSGAPQPVWQHSLSSRCGRESGAHAEGARCASAVGPQESFSIPEDVPSFPAAFDCIVLQDLEVYTKRFGLEFTLPELPKQGILFHNPFTLIFSIHFCCIFLFFNFCEPLPFRNFFLLQIYLCFLLSETQAPEAWCISWS